MHRHSGYPGGLKSETYAEKMARKPEQAVMDTIRGTIPKTRLGRAQISKLKVYAGPTTLTRRRTRSRSRSPTPSTKPAPDGRIAEKRT